ncbi:MAG: hypothetical protein HFE44_11845 [Oscillospiraceae bacterium]|jgi:hypothetical protein|nr:hypothetical protein [Oscillospiraceae bacterium]
MEFVVVIVGAALLAGIVKLAADWILSGEDKKAKGREDAIAQGTELTAWLVRRAEAEGFAPQGGELGEIRIEELGAYGARLIGMEDGEEKTPDAGKDSPPPEGGEHVVLALRWKNIGKDTLRRVIFAVAFLSPEGEVLRPDALDPEPWLRQFGCAAGVIFTGHFGPGQGRMQRDMRNPFLLYHAPVGKAVILGVKAEREDGTEWERTVLAR